MVHKYFVHQGLEDEIQSNESLSPVVTNEQFLDCEAQGLPQRIGLPALLAIASETAIKVLKLPDSVGNSLHATHFIACLQRCRDDDASARGHLSNIRRQHL